MHVILGRKNLKEIKMDFNIYDHLVATFSRNGEITFATLRSGQLPETAVE